MREILFRGKRLDSGEWVEGDYYHEQVGGYLTAALIIEQLTSGVCERHRVDPATVGQFTGLYDSTKWEQLTEREREQFVRKGGMPSEWKGKKNFEGDIVRGYNTFHEREEQYVSAWEGNCFYLFDDCESAWHPEHIRDIEIIGNIHDNPELMKGDNDAIL